MTFGALAMYEIEASLERIPKGLAIRRLWHLGGADGFQIPVGKGSAFAVGDEVDGVFEWLEKFASVHCGGSVWVSFVRLFKSGTTLCVVLLFLLLAVFEPLAELASSERREATLCCPRLHGGHWNQLERDVVHGLAGSHRRFPHGGRAAEDGPACHGWRAGACFFDTLFFGLVAVSQQEFREWNVDWADFVAGSAKAGGFREVGVVGVVFTSEKRAEHCSHWSGIDGSVGVTAGLAVDRANVEARAAADAAEDFLEFAAEDVAALVVEEDNVHVFRSLGLSLGLGAVDELGVDGELLAGCRAGEKV